MSNIINITDFAALQRLSNDEYANEIVALNEVTAEYGLKLTKTQAQELIETRTNALRDNARIEIGLGALNGLIKTFASSPYLDQNNYAETLNDLIELFYHYKTESHDKVSDKELFEIMRHKFDDEYFGSIELMQGRDFRYGKGYNEKPFEYRIGNGDDNGEDPSDDSDYTYLWDKNNGR